MTTDQRSLLFIGVGKMGLPMARHLHEAGHRVTAFDPSPERRALAAALGITVVDGLADALPVTTLVFSSLPDDAALSSVGETVAALAPEGATA